MRWERQYNDIQRSNDIPIIPSLEEIYTQIPQVSPLQAGDNIMQDIMNKLNKLQRSEMQIQMHHLFLKCCAHIIYGADTVAKYQQIIKKKWGWDDLKQEHIIITPRRFGKSYGVAMFACALALCKPGIEITIFSTGRRASGSDGGLMMLIKKFMSENFHLDPTYIIKSNDERFQLRFADNDTRKINAFPGSVHT